MGSGDLKAFEARAEQLLDLLLYHRQFEDATNRFHEFDGSFGPDIDAAVPAEDGSDFRFGEADDQFDGDAHVQALMVVGPSGSGKSQFLNWISGLPHLANDFSSPDGDVRPVVRFDVPDPPTPKEVIREICTKLHSPAPVRWTRNQISRHLRVLFRDVGVRYLQMDEAHVFIEGATARQAVVNARFLKFMLVNCRVPIILAGEEPLEELLAHKALARRTQAPVRLGPYQWGSYDDVLEWLGLTGSLAEQLGFADSALSSDVDVAMRIYLDTGGIIGLLAKRLVEAGRFAALAGANDITLAHLSSAWRRWTPQGSGIAADPFLIVDQLPKRQADDPYVVHPKRLKELWFKRFHENVQDDPARQTRRGTHGKKLASFGR